MGILRNKIRTINPQLRETFLSLSQKDPHVSCGQFSHLSKRNFKFNIAFDSGRWTVILFI